MAEALRGAPGGAVVGGGLFGSLIALEMMPLVGLAVLLVLVGIIVLSTAKSSTPGALITGLGVVLGLGAGAVIFRGAGPGGAPSKAAAK